MLSLEELSLSQKIIVVLVSAGGALLIGLGIGKLFFPGSQPKNVASETPAAAPASDTTSKFSGVIRPADTSKYSEGTHQLTNQKGETLAILSPSKTITDLKFLEGAEVEVEGKITRYYDKIPLLEVAKVRF